MDQPLTPKRIQRLMFLAAEDRSFNVPGYSASIDRINPDLGQSTMPTTDPLVNSQTLSSGILDLDQYDGFGDIDLASISLSKSTAFTPGEMTGRSTGTDDVSKIGTAPTFSDFGRYSVNSIDSLTKKMNLQSSDVKELMRQSIASQYSHFSTKKDLTAEEASFIRREGIVPVPPSKMNLKDSMISTIPDEDRSMGSYFHERCAVMSQMLGRTGSPQYELSNVTVGTLDDSSIYLSEAVPQNKNFKNDATLDSVPVRQPKPRINQSNLVSPKKTNVIPQPVTSTVLKPPQGVFRDPSKQHLHSFMRPTEESCRSDEYETSLSISKIGVILQNESTVNVSDMLIHMKNQKPEKKQPLTEIDANYENRRMNSTQVTTLKDSSKSETASSAGTINTVIDAKRNKENTQSTLSYDGNTTKSRSKSPSLKSTFNAGQEGFASTMMSSGDSPHQVSKGKCKSSHVVSPNVGYRELDKSVDWCDLLQTRASRFSTVAEQWAEVKTEPIEGFVGVCTSTMVTVKSLSESWLTASLDFTISSADINIDLPRFPTLVTPGQTQEFALGITSNIEIDGTLPFTLRLKDSSTDTEAEIKCELTINVRMPSLQAISSGGMNRVVFPIIEEDRCISKSFVLISDCSVDLQLDLCKVGEEFAITSVQEIKKCDVTKKLLDCQEEGKEGKGKGSRRQLCRLSSGNAIKVTVTFTAPKCLDEMPDDNKKSFIGSIKVHLIGINTLLKKVDLVGTVGAAELHCELSSNNIHLTSEISTICFTNVGTVRGKWAVKLPEAQSHLFKVSANTLEVEAGAKAQLKVASSGREDGFVQCPMIIESSNGNSLKINLSAGQDKEKSKVFPVKTNCTSVSWVRPGRKEISLKNTTNKRIQLKCRIVGDAFFIDTPRMAGQTLVLSFGPCECRPLPLAFRPPAAKPAAATLHLAYEKDNEISRKITLSGACGGAALSWRGLVTYGDTALVRALARQPIELKLANRSDAPAFLSARVHFNLQYMSLAGSSRVSGARRVVGARGSAAVALQLPWAAVERRAASASTALATVTVLTGAEVTRRRILKILRDEAGGELDISSLPEHLQPLAGPFENEDPSMDLLLNDFRETKASLDELIGGLQELTAQIDLPQDLADENTILITDETVIDHHTLCE